MRSRSISIDSRWIPRVFFFRVYRFLDSFYRKVLEIVDFIGIRFLCIFFLNFQIGTFLPFLLESCCFVRILLCLSPSNPISFYDSCCCLKITIESVGICLVSLVSDGASIFNSCGIGLGFASASPFLLL